MIQFLRDLIAIPSLSGEEGAAIERCTDEMRSLGFDLEVDEAGNALGVVGDGSRRLLFDAHADTVAPNPEWTRDPYAAEIDGERIYGLAATDMKGPIAALLHGVADAARSGRLAVTVGVSITTLEEVAEGATLAPLLERFSPDAVVIAEPSANRVTLAQKGRAELWIDVEGKAAHAAFPDEGASALLGAAEILLALEQRDPPADPELGEGILVATEAITEPFPGVSVVPSRCRLRLDRRLLPGETGDDVLAELGPYLQAAARAGARARASISDGSIVTYTGVTLPARRLLPAWQTSPDAPFARAALTVLPRGPAAAFCTNGSLTASRGIPTVIFGPGDPARAHHADEYIERAELERGRKGFAALAAIDLVRGGRR